MVGHSGGPVWVMANMHGKRPIASSYELRMDMAWEGGSVWCLSGPFSAAAPLGVGTKRDTSPPNGTGQA